MTGLSAKNPAVQHLRRLDRRRSARLEAGAFVIEGPVLVTDALDAGVELEALYIEEPAAGSAVGAELCTRAAALNIRCLTVAAGVLDQALTTVTPQPVAAIGRMLDRPLRWFTSTATGFVLVLDRVSDPGNAGTTLRSAEAAGAKGVIACGDAVDLYNSKTVRSSAGSLFRVPVAVVDEPAAFVVQHLGTAGFDTLATVMEGGDAYDEIDLTAPVAVVLGSEAHGVSPEVAASVARRVSIPMAGSTESLNVAMAATVLCFEMARQRRRRSEGADPLG